MRRAMFLWLMTVATFVQAQNFLPDVGTFSCQHRKQQLGNGFKSLAGQGRSDTIDVTHYKISLDISDLPSRQISGECELTVFSKINGLTDIKLDLKALVVDAVTVDGNTAAFTQNGELLSIQVPAMNSGDSAIVNVTYGGTPATDPSGFGGFYMTNTYAYNIGVAFADDPHNYGRVWFPCVDNFVDRATYEQYITTAPNHKAFCGGLLLDSASVGGKMVWHWLLSEPIPTYLASVAVSEYTSIEYTYNGIEADFPVILAVRPTDSARISLVFANLPDAIGAFEDNFGAQPFSRVGYAMVPFNGGAMEHATNIAFPAGTQANIDGELLMAHELAHHWFGDWVTCSTPQDMWLNEGWASYCEKIYLEEVYGPEAYTKEVRANHEAVLRLAHVRDGGFYAVSGVGHDLTYSTTVYDKGADVAHTLRGYLGDNLFFSCVKSYLAANGFMDVSSQTFRDHLSQCSGINLTAFFDNWVFAPGFPHFNIDTVIVRSAAVSGFTVQVEIRQLLKEAPAYYQNVPLDVTYFGPNGEQDTERVLMGGSCGTHTTTLPYAPVYVALDMQEKISDAITDKYLTINTTGSYDFEEAKMTLDVTQVTDSALVRVEHHWVGPTVWNTFNALPQNLHVSPDRYFTIDGVWPQGFQASATFDYNGTTSTSAGYLDNNLITNREDSLIVLYRPYGKADWEIYRDASFNYLTNTNDKRGRVTLTNLQAGDYVLAIYDASRATQHNVPDTASCKALSTAIGELQLPPSFSIYPNPTTDTFIISFMQRVAKPVKVEILDMGGKVIWSQQLKGQTTPLEIPTNGWAKGTYLVKMTDDSNLTHTQKLIKTE